VWKSFRDRALSNRTRYKRFNLFLALFSPIFIVLVVEFNHMQSAVRLVDFIWNQCLAFLFDILLMSVLFVILLGIIRSVWLSVFLLGGFCLMLSFVEYFKYKSSRTHFVLTDLVMTGDASQIAKFANLEFTIINVLCILLFVAYTGLCIWFCPGYAIKYGKALTTSAVCFIGVIATVLVPSVSASVYEAFGIDNRMDINTFIAHQKFENNSMIAYLAQTGTESIHKDVQEPEEYSEEVVRDSLVPPDLEGQEVNPHIVVVMSESYGDFRQLGWEVEPGIYDNFDAISSQGLSGTAIVPTFGGTTIRTELELLLGLPMKSLNDPSAPQTLFDTERSYPSLARYFSLLGYGTTYIHPYVSSFYDRDQVYVNLDFDKLLFQEDFTVPLTQYNTYIDDQTVFDQILYELETSDKPSYIHATTMQNHKPYLVEDESQTEFDIYIQGIAKTDEALQNFMDVLEKMDELVLVLFVGDHFPFLIDENNPYDQLGIDASNCSALYEQRFFIWNNYGAQIEWTGDISAFYLPYLLIEAAGLEQTEFIASMVEMMYENSVYSTNYKEEIPNDSTLDLLAYDRLFGEFYSLPEDFQASPEPRPIGGSEVMWQLFHAIHTRE